MMYNKSYNPQKVFQPELKLPLIQELPISSVCIAEYQRPVDKARVEAIASEFNPDRMHPIDVSLRDGKYWCFDGQHRFAAYRKLAKHEIPAIIHYGLSYEQEAELFYKQDMNVRSVSASVKFAARKESRDRRVLDSCEIMRKWGFYVKRGNPSQDGHIVNCPALLNSIINEFSAENFEAVFSILSRGFQHAPYSGRSEIIEGMCHFIKAYQDKDIKWDRLVKMLNGTTPQNVLRDSKRYICKNNGDRVAHVLVVLYNQNLRANTRIEQMFHED